MATRVGELSSVLPAAQPAPWWADQVTDRTLAGPKMVDRLVEITAEVLRSAWAEAKAAARKGLNDWLIRAIPYGAREVHSWLKRDNKNTVEFFSSFPEV
eukprot:785335-Pyramimonas_sp.AAC.1